jgi:hypothetical protein
MPIRPGNYKLNSKEFFKNYEKCYSKINTDKEKVNNKQKKFASRLTFIIPFFILCFVYRHKITLFILRDRDEIKSNVKLTDIDIINASEEEKLIGYTSGLIKKKEI